MKRYTMIEVIDILSTLLQKSYKQINILQANDSVIFI